MTLTQYLVKNDIAVAEFARRVGVASQTVYRWLHAEREPDAATMRRIHVATGGKVTPNDIVLRPVRRDAPEVA